MGCSETFTSTKGKLMTKKISRETLDLLLVPSTATLTSVLRQHDITCTFMHGVAPLKPDMNPI